MKIGLFNFTVVDDLGCDIYEIKIDYPDCIFEKKIKELNDRKESNPENIKSFIQSLKRIGFDKDFDNLIIQNLDQVFRSNRYFIGGSKVITVNKSQGKYLITLHNRSGFTNFHLSPGFFSHTSFDNNKTKDFVSEMSMKLEIVKSLGKQFVTMIPIYQRESSYATIRYLSTGGTEFKYGDITHVEESSSYYGTAFDSLLEEFTNKMKPNILKCCLNCQKFGFSGMSHDMSGGTVGYCSLLLANTNNRKGVKDRITNVTSWCNSFKPK